MTTPVNSALNVPLGAAVYEGVRVGEDARADERGEADEEEERRKEAGKELAVNVVKIALHQTSPATAARRTFLSSGDVAGHVARGLFACGDDAC